MRRRCRPGSRCGWAALAHQVLRRRRRLPLCWSTSNESAARSGYRDEVRRRGTWEGGRSRRAPASSTIRILLSCSSRVEPHTGALASRNLATWIVVGRGPVVEIDQAAQRSRHGASAQLGRGNAPDAECPPDRESLATQCSHHAPWARRWRRSSLTSSLRREEPVSRSNSRTSGAVRSKSAQLSSCSWTMRGPARSGRKGARTRTAAEASAAGRLEQAQRFSRAEDASRLTVTLHDRDAEPLRPPVAHLLIRRRATGVLGVPRRLHDWRDSRPASVTVHAGPKVS